jgi:hypothetical protein
MKRVDRSIAERVTKGNTKQPQERRHVWSAYRDNIKQKKGGQIVPTVLLAQHHPTLPMKTNVSHVATVDFNETKVQQSVWIAYRENTKQKKGG